MNISHLIGNRAFLLVLVALALLIWMPYSGISCTPYTIVGDSMAPTINSGDHFLMNSKAYDAGHLPRRGDMIVFKSPQTGEPMVIKRVIGIPGDSVQLSGRDISINGNLVKRQQVGSSNQVYNEFIETLPDGTVFHIFENKNTPGSSNGVQHVPPGEYFIVGDNRDNARDSRNGRGFIPWVDILGKAVFFF